MKKYVFIDFDGVLNTERYHNELVNFGHKCSDQFGPLFDPSAVRNLKEIVEKACAEIVIISSWKFEGVNRMRELWDARKMPGVLIGCTPDYISSINLLDLDLNDPGTFAQFAGKGNEVKQWLIEHAPKRTEKYRYVILDDVPDFLPEQMGCFIQVDPRVGITEADATRTILLLNQ